MGNFLTTLFILSSITLVFFIILLFFAWLFNGDITNLLEVIQYNSKTVCILFLLNIIFGFKKE